MRTRTNSIVAAFVLLSLVSGAIGCRSNGGPWYNPKTYSWNNPFSKTSDAPPYEAEGMANANPKPSMGAQPDVNVPPGGYTNKEEEARFLAGKNEGTVMVPQYGAASLETNKVATTAGTAAPQSMYPETPVYNPYAAVDNSAVGGLNNTSQPVVYQDTNLHTASVQQSVPGMYAAPVAADPAVYPGMTSAPATPAPAGGYSPYANPVQAAPVQESAPIYGTPQTNYAAPVTTPQSSYAAPAATMPTGYGAPATTSTGYGVQPQVQSNPYGASTNTNSSLPPIYPNAAPQGF